MDKYEIEVNVMSDPAIRYPSDDICKMASSRFPLRQALRIMHILGEMDEYPDFLKERIIWLFEQAVRKNNGNWWEINNSFDAIVLKICDNVINKYEKEMEARNELLAEIELELCDNT